MTHISFTSGEILDIVSSLEATAKRHEDSGDAFLALYYGNMIQQFYRLREKLQEFPGENRVANLVLACN